MESSENKRGIVKITTNINESMDLKSIVDEVIVQCDLLEKIGHLPEGTLDNLMMNMDELEKSVAASISLAIMQDDEDEGDDDEFDEDYDDDDFEDDDLDVDDFDIADDDEWWEDDEEDDFDETDDDDDDFEDMLEKMKAIEQTDLTPTLAQRN